MDLFNVPQIHDLTAMRGGIPLHKVVLAPASRYSDDIDLTAMTNTPIGPMFDAIRVALAWLDPKPGREIGMFPKMFFRFATTAGARRRLKVEVATRETFSAARTIDLPYAVTSRYFTGQTQIRTYTLDELLASKLRVLLQREKGRDLFDLYYAAHQQAVDFAHLYALFLEYWTGQKPSPMTRGMVNANMVAKHDAKVFDDVLPVLAPNVTYVPNDAYTWFGETILPLFPAV